MGRTSEALSREWSTINLLRAAYWVFIWDARGKSQLLAIKCAVLVLGP